MYIFGIDLPIMELLFVFGIFLLIALIVVWLEIRKLRVLVMMEQANIYRFKQDTIKPKSEEMEKNLKALDEFIKVNLEKGFTKGDIWDVLVRKGWPKELVKKAFEKLNKQTFYFNK